MWRTACAVLVGLGHELEVGLPAGIIELLVDEDAGQVFVEIELAGGLLGFLDDLLGDLRLGSQLLLQRLEALLMFTAQCVERGFVFGSQLLVGARLGIHLLGQYGVFLSLAFEQASQLLVVL